MIQPNDPDDPEMLTEPGKQLDGDTSLFKETSETQHEVELNKSDIKKVSRQTTINFYLIE
jgi:hypothetical protein